MAHRLCHNGRATATTTRLGALTFGRYSATFVMRNSLKRYKGNTSGRHATIRWRAVGCRHVRGSSRSGPLWLGRRSDDALSLSWTPHTKARAGVGAPDLASAMPALTTV